MPFKFQNQMKPQSHGLLAVSIGQKNQTGPRFQEEVQAVLAAAHLEKVSILKADSLQRFHYMAKEGLSEQEALVKAMAVATQWESDNQEALTLLKSKGGKVYSYQDFYAPSVAEREQVLAFYEDNSTFKNKVHGIARNFTRDIKAKMGEGAEQHHDRIFQAMKNFLLEESGIYIFLSKHSDNFEYIIYPGDMPSPVKEASKKFIDSGRAIHIRLVYHSPKEELTNLSVNAAQKNTNRETFWASSSSASNATQLKNIMNENMDISRLDDELIKELTMACEFIFGNALKNRELDHETRQELRNNLLIELIKFMKTFIDNALQKTQNKVNSFTCPTQDNASSQNFNL
ncbi:MAG: hypothetical protein ACX932_04605 [Gammaproteobacteria bacterium]